MIDLIKRHGEQLLTAMEQAVHGQRWTTLMELDRQLAELMGRIQYQPDLKERLPLAHWQVRHRHLITQLEARQTWLSERLRGDNNFRESKRAYREVQLYGGEKQ